MLNIHVLNVQNGDSIVLEYINGGHRYFGLIDSNILNSRNPALEKLQELGAEHLSFVMITHPHGDHYGGMIEVLEFFKGRIDRFITCPLANALQDAKNFKRFCILYQNLINKQDGREVSRGLVEWLKILKYGHDNFLPHGKWLEMNGPSNSITFQGFGDDVRFSFVMPPPKARGGKYLRQIESGSLFDPEGTAANDISLAVYVSYAGKIVLLAGDTESANWQFAHKIYKDDLKKSSVVKLPHHGSKYDCDPASIDIWYDLDAENNIGIISAKGNKHPDESVLDCLIEKSIKPYCTNVAKKWRAAGTVKDFINTKGVDTKLAQLVHQISTSKSGSVVPCKGNICIQITPEGKLEILTQFNNMCGCQVDEIEKLIAAARR